MSITDPKYVIMLRGGEVVSLEAKVKLTKEEFAEFAQEFAAKMLKYSQSKKRKTTQKE